MKILAIVYTLGEIIKNQPEDEQFILMHKMGISLDFMSNKDSEYEQIFKDAGLQVVGDYQRVKRLFIIPLLWIFFQCRLEFLLFCVQQHICTYW